jgi:hypothetical protein
MLRRHTLFLALAGAMLSGCERSPTTAQRTGSGEVTITSARGAERITRAEAGAYVYSPGPTTDTRSLYVRLAAGDTADLAVEVELSVVLAPNQDLPVPATYTFGTGGPGSVSYGSNLIWRGGPLRQYVAYAAPSTLTIETSTAERITGRFSMEATELHRTERVTLSGVFSAERVTRFEDLPRVR